MFPGVHPVPVFACQLCAPCQLSQAPGFPLSLKGNSLSGQWQGKAALKQDRLVLHLSLTAWPAGPKGQSLSRKLWPRAPSPRSASRWPHVAFGAVLGTASTQSLARLSSEQGGSVLTVSCSGLHRIPWGCCHCCLVLVFCTRGDLVLELLLGSSSMSQCSAGIKEHFLVPVPKGMCFGK